MGSRIWRVLVLALVLSILVAGASMIFAAKPPSGCPQGKPGCFCPTYYDPVICNGDCIYSNACFARCAGAKGCQPLGPGPIPL